MACKRTLVIGSAQYAMSVAGGGSQANRLVNGAPNYAMVIVCGELQAETFFRLLEDGTSRRLLEDGTSRRLLEIAP